MTALDVTNISANLQWAGSFLIILLVFVFHNSSRAKSITILGVYASLSFLLQFMQLADETWFEGQHMNMIGDFSVLSELSCFMFLYAVIFKSGTVRIITYSTIVLYTLFFFYFLPDQANQTRSDIRTIRDLLLIIYSVGYFFYLLRNLPDEHVSQLPLFWINSSVLFFFSCTFMLSLSMKYLIELLQDDFGWYWAARNTLRLLFCIAICFGLLKARRYKIVSG